jgi:hypothetical protein
VNKNDELTGTERQDPGPEVTRMERHVNTGKRNGGETTVELDIAVLKLLLVEGLLVALLDDIGEHLLDLLDGVGLGKLQYQ